MTGLQNIHIGTSGWHYLHWRGPFYPDKLAPGDFLSFYVKQFVTVEINNSFYRLPTPATLLRWRDAVPPGFRFAVKASRFLTHMKKLAEAETALALFLERVRLLGDKPGPVHFQLPPGWGFYAERLRGIAEIPPTLLYRGNYPGFNCHSNGGPLQDGDPRRLPAASPSLTPSRHLYIPRPRGYY